MLAFLTDSEWTAVRLSAEVALWAVVVSVVPGVLCAWVLARGRFRGKALLDAVIHLPLVLPPVVTGYALLLVLGRRGVVGRWLDETLGIEIAFTRTAAVIAAAVIGFPLLVRASRLGIELVDRGLEDAARTLGAGTWRRLLTITVPLALPGILTGVVLTFARGLGEFGATITFAGNVAGETRTLPLAVYTFTQVPGGDAPAMRLVVISIVLSLTALLMSEVLARRVSARLGRR
ncbi:MAG: molybdate ABC transporter permease subunit [Planctomycetes bacterium]|nr:molybdate ABC transporter permease subunit [Planctomycetota bacterium]